MFRGFMRVVALLVLIAALDARDLSVFVHLLALPAAILLYPFAASVLLAVLASPFLECFGFWLLWRWVRDGRTPDSVHRTIGWAHTRRPWGYRLRIERRQPSSTQPSSCEQPQETRPDGDAAPA